MERTVSIKLGGEHSEEFEELGKEFVRMMNEVVEIAWNAKQFSSNGIHYLCYSDIRNRFQNLKSNHICAAFRVVSGALQSGRTRARRKRREQTKPKFTRPTVAFDIRTSKITSEYCTLSTLGKRIRVDYTLSPYQLKFFDGSWKIGGSRLVKRECGNWFLNVSVSKDAPPIRETGRTIGIDQGIRHVAVTSSGKFITGGHLNHRTSQMRLRRGELQSKGTPAARRRLKRLGRRENRFRDDVLHCAVKSILSNCEDVRTIVVEDLKKIEKNRGRNLNRQTSNWSFAKFRGFLESKSEELGIVVESVDPRYTSQKCSGCEVTKKSNRNFETHLYSCSCGLILNDDLNAARNIRANHLRAIGEGDGAQSTSPDATTSVCRKPTNSIVGS